jgi:hypothetical protein
LCVNVTTVLPLQQTGLVQFTERQPHNSGINWGGILLVECLHNVANRFLSITEKPDACCGRVQAVGFVGIGVID